MSIQCVTIVVHNGCYTIIYGTHLKQGRASGGNCGGCLAGDRASRFGRSEHARHCPGGRLHDGGLTHHFRDKRELMGYAFGLLVGRIAERSARVARERGLFEALCELLPLDEDRRREAVAWLALISASSRDQELAEDLRRRYDEALAVGISAGREFVGEEIVSEENFEDAADELIITVDGIAVGALTNPERYPPSRQVSLLRRVFDRMGLPTGPP